MLSPIVPGRGVLLRKLLVLALCAAPARAAAQIAFPQTVPAGIIAPIWLPGPQVPYEQQPSWPSLIDPYLPAALRAPATPGELPLIEIVLNDESPAAAALPEQKPLNAQSAAALPGLTAAAASETLLKSGSRGTEISVAGLDKAFDGAANPDEGLPGHDPVSGDPSESGTPPSSDDSHRQTLPEWELERELGLR